MTAPALVGPLPSGGGPAPSPHRARHIPRRPERPRTYVTARETEVLRLVANGNTNQAIARQLGIGAEAVNSRMQSLMRKLRVHDRAQAVAVLTMEDVVVPEGANRGYGNTP